MYRAAHIGENHRCKAILYRMFVLKLSPGTIGSRRVSFRRDCPSRRCLRANRPLANRMQFKANCLHLCRHLAARKPIEGWRDREEDVNKQLEEAFTNRISIDAKAC